MRALAVLGVIAAIAASPAFADPAGTALEVAPTTLELARNVPGLLYLANRSPAPVTVQIDISDWRQTPDGDRLSASTSAFVSPPQTTIAPGERQIVRVLASPPQAEAETSYRLVVSEIPGVAEAQKPGVHVLLQLSLPVFVRGESDKTAVAWSASLQGQTMALCARNTGARTLKIAGLQVSSAAGSTDVTPGRVDYLLPDAMREWPLKMPGIASGAPIHVSGVDERGGAALDADIVVAR